jgi:hypothetical protein
MFVILKSEIKIEVIKIYSIRSKKRQFINDTINKLHEQKKMHWIKKSINHEIFVFVIWRMINEKQKKWMIIDIHNLNKIVKFDFYSMFLQVNIISTVVDFKFISIIDAAIFFYQFRIRILNKHKLIVISHRKREYFSVAFMNFKNSLTYAQRQINIILRDLKHCCRILSVKNDSK